jgi:hypothetical protein
MPLLLIKCESGSGKFCGIFSAGAHGNFHFFGNAFTAAGQFVQVLPHDHGAFVIHNMIVIHVVMMVPSPCSADCALVSCAVIDMHDRALMVML